LLYIFQLRRDSPNPSLDIDSQDELKTISLNGIAVPAGFGTLKEQGAMTFLLINFRQRGKMKGHKYWRKQ
jgi:hypothetical protein